MVAPKLAYTSFRIMVATPLLPGVEGLGGYCTSQSSFVQKLQLCTIQLSKHILVEKLHAQTRQICHTCTCMRYTTHRCRVNHGWISDNPCVEIVPDKTVQPDSTVRKRRIRHAKTISGNKSWGQEICHHFLIIPILLASFSNILAACREK